MSDYLDIASGTTTMRIQTPLMANARIKGLSAVTIIDGTEGISFNSSTVSSMSSGTEYWFKSSGSIPSPLSRIQTNGNNIVFRRYDSSNTLLEETMVGRAVLNPDDNSITVYKHTGGSTYETYKTTTYPITSGH